MAAIPQPGTPTGYSKGRKTCCGCSEGWNSERSPPSDTIDAESWGRPGFDAGHEAAQGTPRSSHLVKPLEILRRQRRALRSSRLIPARRCTGLLVGQASAKVEVQRHSHQPLPRLGRLAARIRRSDWLSVSLPAGGGEARLNRPG